MKLLVCGGAGFIGSNFILYMLNTYKDLQIVNYDKLTYAGNLDNLSAVVNNPNYSFEKGDITDLPRLIEVMKKHQITHVINFAAETHVDRSIHGGTKEFVLTNTLGVQMILDAVRFSNIKKFINVSTDEVYGSLKLDEDRKFTEATPILPNMPYAAAKAGGDLMCNAYWVTHKVPVIVTHCSNNYGPYQFPEKLIPFFVFKLLKGEKIPVYGDGLNVRDWIHARDHAQALDILLQKGTIGEVYNIGVDNERSNLEVTKMVLDIMGFNQDRIEYVTDRPGHDRRYAIDATKIMSLGWLPDYSREKFAQGLRETIEWYKHNTEWVEKIWSKKKDEMNKFQENLQRSKQKQKASI
jgi:dTDP-glucose 4,6-dehydratase